MGGGGGGGADAWVLEGLVQLPLLSIESLLGAGLWRGFEAAESLEGVRGVTIGGGVGGSCGPGVGLSSGWPCTTAGVADVLGAGDE
jgi:hypothetical protein